MILSTLRKGSMPLLNAQIATKQAINTKWVTTRAESPAFATPVQPLNTLADKPPPRTTCLHTPTENVTEHLHRNEDCTLPWEMILHTSMENVIASRCTSVASDSVCRYSSRRHTSQASGSSSGAAHGALFMRHATSMHVSERATREGDHSARKQPRHVMGTW